MKSASVRLLCAVWVAALILAARPTTVHSAPPANGPVVHVVRWGENLAQIAAHYQVSVYQIAQANHLADPNHIRVGQRLVIPLSPAPASPREDIIVHTVQSGESLGLLAAHYGTTVSALVQANGLVNPAYVYAGQVLAVPAQPRAANEGAYYRVRAGDTLPAIAHRYRVSYWSIAQANYLPNPSLIQAGQVLYIPGAILPVALAVTVPTATAWPEDAVGRAARTVSASASAEPGDVLEAGDGERIGIAHGSGMTPHVWGTPQHDVLDATGVRSMAEPVSQAAPEPEPTATAPCEHCTPVAPTSTPAPLRAGACVLPATHAIAAEPVALPAPAGPKPLYMQSPEYGMTIQVWGTGDCITDRDLRLVKEAGFTWVRQSFRWRDIEVSKGQFQWNEADRIVAAVAARGLDLAIAVSHQPQWAGSGYPRNGPPDNMADFAQFMGALARRYRGLVRAYEIWPGPNVSENWGGGSPSPDRYAEMLIDGYWYVKEQDPYAMIISGGLAQTADHDAEAIPPFEFLEMLYERTDAPRSCDVWGVQARGFKAAPEHPPEELALPDLNNHYPATAERNRVWGFRSIEVMQGYTAAPERPIKKQWIVTELGWTTTPYEGSPLHWAAVPEEVKADYVVRAYRWAQQAWADWVGVMFVPLTDARLTESDEGYWWLVVDPDGEVRPAYSALKHMPK